MSINESNVWSTCIQGPHTLYCSRALRFHDMFFSLYEPLFALDRTKPLRILEIGCGPGALAGALRRWYPQAHITALDRDTNFIEFARTHESGIDFLVGDATALPFADNTFDVTISNTVAEHIDPQYFYAEQYRVLCPNGICLVLSARRGITVEPPDRWCSDFEKAFWNKVNTYDKTMDTYAVGRYPMTEAELPAIMERYGFRCVSTGFAAISLTPDHPAVSPALARDMLRAVRETTLEAIRAVAHTIPEHVTEDEITEMLRLAHETYDRREKQYTNGERQWDTQTSLTMVIRGMK